MGGRDGGEHWAKRLVQLRQGLSLPPQTSTAPRRLLGATGLERGSHTLIESDTFQRPAKCITHKRLHCQLEYCIIHVSHTMCGSRELCRNLLVQRAQAYTEDFTSNVEKTHGSMMGAAIKGALHRCLTQRTSSSKRSATARRDRRHL